MFRKMDGLDWQVIGSENIPEGPFIIASKHQSAWDTIFFTAYFKDASMVLKKILIYIPAYGWLAMKAKMIWLDRKGRATAIRHLINQARSCAKDKRPIVIFPEGTRIKVGLRGEYKAGAFALYKYLGIPCVPVALNSGLFWETKGYKKQKGKVTVKFLKIIEPGYDKKEFFSILENSIETETQKLLRQ